MSLNHFVIKVFNRNGNHERSWVRLIASTNEKEACKKALISECHGEVEDLDFADGGVYDYNGENYYSIKSCVMASPDDVSTLQLYF